MKPWERQQMAEKALAKDWATPRGVKVGRKKVVNGDKALLKELQGGMVGKPARKRAG